MGSIKAFLDTDVILNWLCKEATKEGEALWEAPYEILKKAEKEEIVLYTTLINIMEIRFVLRRKKKWKELEIEEVIRDLGKIDNFGIIIPEETDLITGFNFQASHMLDPFDAIYLSVVDKISGFLISRDRDFINIVNKIKGKLTAFTPESFLETIK